MNSQDPWELRNKALDFIQVSALLKDEAALTWLLQKTITALMGLIPAERILQHVRHVLPKDIQEED